MPHFNRYIGIDYSGAETPDSSCRGLRVYVAEGRSRLKNILTPAFTSSTPANLDQYRKAH